MADKTVRLTVDAQETLSSEDIASLFEILNLPINFLVVPSQDDVPSPTPPKPKLDKGEQSPSQRLRQAIFNRWEELAANAAPQRTFEDYYQATIDRIIARLTKD
jgi:hypothetical protein